MWETLIALYLVVAGVVFVTTLVYERNEHGWPLLADIQWALLWPAVVAVILYFGALIFINWAVDYESAE